MGPEEAGPRAWVAGSALEPPGLTKPLAGEGWYQGPESWKRRPGLAKEGGLPGEPCCRIGTPSLELWAGAAKDLEQTVALQRQHGGQEADQVEDRF